MNDIKRVKRLCIPKLKGTERGWFDVYIRCQFLSLYRTEFTGKKGKTKPITNNENSLGFFFRVYLCLPPRLGFFCRGWPPQLDRGLVFTPSPIQNRLVVYLRGSPSSNLSWVLFLEFTLPQPDGCLIFGVHLAPNLIVFI